ncbi:MAG: hypothetical protein R2712_05090 [Vicinamibacterales bacterium]
MSIHIEHPAPGVATVSLGSAGRRLTYRTEAESHRIAVFDDFGQVVLAFGGYGRGPAALDTPLDLAFVNPLFAGERLPDGPEAVWLAVADYGNARVQVYELDGVHVGTVDLSGQAGIGAPCGLSWRSPILEVEGVECARARVYWSAALLSSAPRAST